MAGKARIQVFWPKAEEYNGPAKASAVDSVMSNKANCPRFWAKNAGERKTKPIFRVCSAGGT